MEEFTFDIRPTTGTNPALFVNGNKHFLRAKNKKGSTHWVCYLNKGSKRCQGKARTEITNGKIELANVWDHTCQCTNSTDKTIMSHIDSTKTASPITKHDKHESTKAIQKKKKTIKTVHPADPNYQTLKDLNGDDIFTRKQPTKESDDSGGYVYLCAHDSGKAKEAAKRKEQRMTEHDEIQEEIIRRKKQLEKKKELHEIIKEENIFDLQILCQKGAQKILQTKEDQYKLKHQK